MRLKTLILGTLFGGLAAFVWSNLSWEAIGWHENTLLSFQKDADVAAAVSSHTVEDGNYLLPYGNSPEAQARMRSGPIVFAAVRRGGIGSLARLFGCQAAILFAGAFLLTWLTMQTSGLSYPRKVLFCAVVGLAAGVMVDLPNWNWWGFGGAFTAANVADDALTALAAGLVIAKVVK